MTTCADLDPFFDGELAAGEATAFRAHLADCARCQAVLHGRMHEAAIVHDASAPAFADRLAARRRARVVVVGAAATAFAAAAAILLWMRVASPRDELSLSWTVASIAGSRASGSGVSPPSMSLGATLRARASVHGTPAAIWLYREGSALVAACPGDACSPDSDSGALVAEFRPVVIGGYELIAATGATLPAPPATSIDAIATLRRAGVHYQVETIRVR
jgi:hypothetical protein